MLVDRITISVSEDAPKLSWGIGFTHPTLYKDGEVVAALGNVYQVVAWGEELVYYSGIGVEADTLITRIGRVRFGNVATIHVYGTVLGKEYRVDELLPENYIPGITDHPQLDIVMSLPEASVPEQLMVSLISFAVVGGMMVVMSKIMKG